METARRAFVAGLWAVGFVALLGGQAAPPAAPPAALSLEETEAFLLNAKIVGRKGVSTGVTDTVQATLSDGRITHDASIQTVDVAQTVFQAGKASEVNFKDTYRFNIAAYRLARLLGLQNVPMSVERRFDGKPGAWTWWIDDVQFDEKGRLKEKNILGPNPDRTSKQVQVMRVFDELIQNRDRNQGNILWTKDWTLWMIDHTRAFRLGKELLKPDQLNRCERSLLEGMRALTHERIAQVMGEFMRKDEIQAVLTRRDVIIKHFEDRIATRGEAVVLFSM